MLGALPSPSLPLRSIVRTRCVRPDFFIRSYFLRCYLHWPASQVTRHHRLAHIRASFSSAQPATQALFISSEASKALVAMELEDAAMLFPKPEGVSFSYGTAGFRAKAELLESTLFRMGVLAALRSLHTGQCTGLMVTASHNPLEDNGVKLADPEGGMLAITWEAHATSLANAADATDVCKVVEEIMRHENIEFSASGGGKVFVARDTRPSGLRLVSAALQGILSVAGAEPQDCGVLTTPQLHWLVRASNMGLPCTEADYFSTLSSSFETLLRLMPQGSVESRQMPLIVDGACGVGALQLAALLANGSVAGLDVEIRNRPGDGGVLNEQVGADFVQKEQTVPKQFDIAIDVGKRCVSMDGDADRLVYFYLTANGPSGEFHLLDGDKIAVLAASFVGDQLRAISGKAVDTSESSDSTNFNVGSFGTVRVGVVQTAYANGASTGFIEKQLGLEVVRTLTGVKYLHEAALAFDIGIYFEANGHGTVLFGAKFLNWLKEECARPDEDAGKPYLCAVRRLVAMSEMVNQAVGDALSGILMVETILRYRGWTVEDWNSLYKDLPSRQLKVKVPDRSAIVTTDAETRVVRPAGLQAVIDAEIAKHGQGRAFVRPSGTEDAVRVYAESASQQAADTLAQDVAGHLQRLMNP